MADYLLYEVTGFDYAQAIRELSHHMTYGQIGKQIGYAQRGSLYKIMKGSTPDHRHGEALWALYCDTIGRKPPLTVVQKAQLTENVMERTPQDTLYSMK